MSNVMTPEEKIIALYNFDSTWLDQRLERLDEITDEEYQSIRDTINEYFRGDPPCAHEYEIAYFIASDHSTRYIRQCVHCFDQTTQISKRALTKAQRENAFERIQPDYSRLWEIKRRLKDEMIAKLDRIRKREWFDWYNDYLASPKWQRRRQFVLKRAGGTCEGCGAAKATHVHHLTYDRVGDEMLFDLVAVCESCHADLHPDNEELQRGIA